MASIARPGVRAATTPIRCDNDALTALRLLVDALCDGVLEPEPRVLERIRGYLDGLVALADGQDPGSTVVRLVRSAEAPLAAAG